MSPNALKHGFTANGKRHKLYGVWVTMRNRCSNPKNPAYSRYGGRGIKVCERWEHSFENFFADMGPCPPGMTLDRKDNNGDYSPENCKWATRKEQANNRRDNRLLTFNGKTQSLAKWSDEIGLSQHAIWGRLKCGGSVAHALTK
jgi:hypothetical protein